MTLFLRSDMTLPELPSVAWLMGTSMTMLLFLSLWLSAASAKSMEPSRNVSLVCSCHCKSVPFAESGEALESDAAVEGETLGTNVTVGQYHQIVVHRRITHQAQ